MMAKLAGVRIGCEIESGDGFRGKAARVIVDPVARVVTHIVVEPTGGGPGRLVPVDLIDDSAGVVRMQCSKNVFEAFHLAEDTHFIEHDSGEDGYVDGQVLAWPYYALGPVGVGDVMVSADPPIMYEASDCWSA